MKNLHLVFLDRLHIRRVASDRQQFLLYQELDASTRADALVASLLVIAF